nr:hypothetical protein [Tanacetum cinerariifolium]
MGEVECRYIIPLPHDKPESRETTSRKTSDKERPRSEGTSSEEMEFKAARLIPAQKCLPLPDKMMTETFGFWSNEDKARGNSLKKASESALWRVGLFRCKVNTDGLLVSSCMISKEVYDEDDIFAAGPMLS